MRPFHASAQAPDLQIWPDSLILMLGSQDSLVVLLNGEPARGSRTAFEWVSSNEAVATVGPGGIVVAVSTGTTEITLRWGALSDQIPVRVLSPASPVSFSIDPKATTLVPGDELDLGLTLTRADGSSMGRPLVDWSSSDPSVVRIAESGIVTAVGEGEAIVTGRFRHLSAQVQVTVLPDPTKTATPGGSSQSGLAPGAAFALGMVLPGVGQMATGQTGRGVLVAAATGGAIYWALQSKEVILFCAGPATGSTCPNQWILERQETDNTMGFAIAGGIALLGAIDAAVTARKNRQAKPGTSSAVIPLPREVRLIAGRRGSSVDFGLRIPVGSR